MSMLLVGLLAAALPWMEDDWEGAKKKALAENKLVAVDVWATWCHTCLSMKNFVMVEPALDKVADRHVWLALDYDQPKNATFFGKIPVSAFPTFLVVDPKSDKVVARWPGSGSAEQMARFFQSASLDATDPLALAQRALAEGNHELALETLRPNIAKEKDPSRKTEMLNAYIEALRATDETLCADQGVAFANDIVDTSPGIDALALALSCAQEIEGDQSKAYAAKIVARLARAAANPKLVLSPDDKSSLLEVLGDGYDTLGDHAKAEQTTKARRALLVAARAAAQTPAAKATYDAHLVGVHLQLKEFSAAEAIAKESERAFPNDFNHPYRLAMVSLEAGKLPDGLEAVNRALSKAYGPRKVRVHTVKIRLLMASKKWDEASKAVAAARDDISKLDKNLVRAAWFDALDGFQTEIENAKTPAN